MKIKDILENKNKQELPQSKPRNFVAKNMGAATSGAGAHRDKKKEAKQGKEKHKNKQYDMAEGHHVVHKIDRDRYTDLSHEGLEGPFSLRSGRVVYYDPMEGKYYDRDTDMYLSHDEYAQHDRHHGHSIDETGEITGTVASVSSDGKNVTVKNSDGSETQTSADAFVPGPNNTVTMKHNAAGDTLKPGAAVTSDEQVSEEGEDDIFAIAPDHEHIHGETDLDLIGSGHNVDIGGDPTDAYVDQVRDKEFERGARGGREGLAGRSKRISENDELAKMLTIAGLR